MPPRDRLVEASVKPIEPAEIDVLARWIAAGRREVAVEPDVATTTPDPLVTDKDRDFWAFRPPPAVAVPAVRATRDRVRNPIDAFVLQKLEQKGPDASRRRPTGSTLLRRAYLRPDRAAARAGRGPTPFSPTVQPDAYEKLIDRLLASPRYGERWGRYWLDLAGYADSEGKREQDLPRPHAWRYRDYVIRSFNADKPYDRFLLEQLAGDELADYETAPEITPEMYDNLVATGFLRMAPDATWANITGYRPGSARGDRRRDRRARLGGDGPDDEVRPLPQPQVRSDSAARLLPAAGRLQGGLRRARLAQAGRPARASARSARTCSAAGTCRTSRRPNAAAGHNAMSKNSASAARGQQAGRSQVAEPGSGAVGSRRAVADVHLSPRRSAESGPTRRAGRALGADRRQDAVRGASRPGRARRRPAGGWPSPAG